MARAKLRVAAKAAKTRATTRARPRPAAIDRARADAMALIARQRGDSAEANALLDKAQLLLTRHWAKADWAARAKLIESAGFLIRVAASPQSRARMRKAR
jgi:ATP/maltotriose-dependent transcriptional regulator MalT